MTNPQPLPPSLLLYDGVCGLCHRFVRFVLHWDRQQRIMFAPLQSALAGKLLARHGQDAVALQSVVLLLNGGTPAERLLVRSDAVAAVLEQLAPPMPFFAKLMTLLPRVLRDWGYDLVAAVRYRIFGKVAMQGEFCALPNESERGRFLSTESNTTLLH